VSGLLFGFNPSPAKRRVVFRYLRGCTFFQTLEDGGDDSDRITARSRAASRFKSALPEQCQKRSGRDGDDKPPLLRHGRQNQRDGRKDKQPIGHQTQRLFHLLLSLRVKIVTGM
jgi:hypothetical protein